MPTRRQNQNQIRQHLAEQLDWRFAERNDQAVAQALYAGQAVDGVHTLDEAGLLDGFFAFLKESDVMAVWQSFRIDGVQRIFIPTIYFVLLYGTRVLFGIESSNALPVLLFSNVAVMTLLGFNALDGGQRDDDRGQSQRTGHAHYFLMDPQTLAETICKSRRQELEQSLQRHDCLSGDLWHLHGRSDGGGGRHAHRDQTGLCRLRLPEGHQKRAQ